MEHKVVAPAVGESITEVRVLKWTKADGQAVKAGEILVEIETDKATVEVAAEAAGALKILKAEGETVLVGTVLGVVDDAVQGKAASPSAAKAAPSSHQTGGTAQGGAAPSSVATKQSSATANAAPSSGIASSTASASTNSPSFLPLSPAVRKLVDENQVNPGQVAGSGKDGRLTKGDVLNHLASPSPSPTAAASRPSQPSVVDRPGDRRVPMTRLRARIAERLLEAQRTAAILTTFNEVDMGPVMDVRNKHKESFKAKNGVSLSFMSFFTRAVLKCLQAQPLVNGSIDHGDVLYHDYFDIGIAVGTERGLVVPILRGVEKMTFVDIEKSIAGLALKARDGKLSIPEMSGGTFTISNGGVYGSLLSTPILNPPQSGILGMHKIMDRAIVVDGKVVVRPMMYLALSYDHRLIDGKEAVTFLVAVKDHLEKPESLGLDF